MTGLDTAEAPGAPPRPPSDSGDFAMPMGSGDEFFYRDEAWETEQIRRRRLREAAPFVVTKAIGPIDYEPFIFSAKGIVLRDKPSSMN